ncbi:response regulator transcription factor [bacterium]|nr:response regulator transcription factor [bacterium]
MANGKDKAIILLVEDEESLADGLEYNLSLNGYEVVRTADGREALSRFRENEPDLIILDIMIPYIDGFEVAEIILKERPRLPILMLTARSDVKDRVRGLEIGVNDYMIKPFHLRELLARIKGMLQRREWYSFKTAKEPLFSFGGFTIDFDSLTATGNDRLIRLTYHEAMVLRYLIENRDRAVDRKELLEKVWHLDSDVETRTVDTFIARLRKYFEKDPSAPVFIKSIRSIGYMFTESEPSAES